MRLLLPLIMVLSTFTLFGQNSEVTMSLVPTGEVVNEFDTIYNLEILIDQTVLEDAQSADLFIEGLDSNFTVQAIDILSPGNSNALPNGNRFIISTENNKKKIVMKNARANDYTARIILTKPNGQHVIEKKQH